jgi:hypothetical protein
VGELHVSWSVCVLLHTAASTVVMLHIQQLLLFCMKGSGVRPVGTLDVEYGNNRKAWCNSILLQTWTNRHA